MEKGGTLLAVKSPSSHDVIRGLLDRSGEDRKYWIGLTRSKWTWNETGGLVTQLVIGDFFVDLL